GVTTWRRLMRLIGYADSWTVRPGDKVGLHVSSRSEQFEVNLLRLRHGDDNPAGPGFLATPIDSEVAGRYAGGWHDIASGSCAVVDDPEDLLQSESFSASIWVYPTKPGLRDQTILSRGAFWLRLNALGRPVASLGENEVIAPEALVGRQWYLLVVRMDRA